MLDVVPNHMAWGGPPNATDWTSLSPFNSPKYYHAPCKIDDKNETSVQVCRQGSDEVSLLDLKTESQDVRMELAEWVRTTVSKYKFDGIRLDSAKHIEPSFWPGFLEAAGVFGLAEYFDGDAAHFPSLLDSFPGAVNYPL